MCVVQSCGEGCVKAWQCEVSCVALMLLFAASSRGRADVLLAVCAGLLNSSQRNVRAEIASGDDVLSQISTGDFSTASVTALQLSPLLTRTTLTASPLLAVGGSASTSPSPSPSPSLSPSRRGRPHTSGVAAGSVDRPESDADAGTGVGRRRRRRSSVRAGSASEPQLHHRRVSSLSSTADAPLESVGVALSVRDASGAIVSPAASPLPAASPVAPLPALTSVHTAPALVSAGVTTRRVTTAVQQQTMQRIEHRRAKQTRRAIEHLNNRK